MAIPVVRSEKLSIGRSRDIPVPVQELVYGSKAAGVGTSFTFVDKENELLLSIKEALEPRKDTGTSEGVYTHLLQRTSSKYKSLVEKPNHFVGGSEEGVDPKEEQPCGKSSRLHKQ
ncbi:hypothetical protein O181_110788 [Austropuccinia psidii MF-1]|uniref:Uncharacterized protein n=1 Tax=Austropuccinia psidii MF-1 TaxID=1389203 RepID=A0A9Q3JXD2_9BASI|nr:hypothetical protein [Austropuccinia psidii MF-1]